MSRLRNSQGPYFRGSFSIGTMLNTFGTNKSVRIIVCVRFSEVSGVGGSIIHELILSFDRLLYLFLDVCSPKL